MFKLKVLLKYERYKIGKVENPRAPYHLIPAPGELSPVPAAEPAWLDKGFRSPYYDDSHKRLQKEVRRYFDTYVKREARERELTNERPSKEIMETMGSPEWEICECDNGR